MAFFYIVILDILFLLLCMSVFWGAVLGIAGIVLQIKNRLDTKKGKPVSKLRKLLTAIFCVLGTITLIVVILLLAHYFIKIKPLR